MNETLSLTYPVKIERDGKGYLVTFRDITNAFTYGETREEAVLNAQEVLDLMLLDAIEKNEEIQLPSNARKGEVLVSASPDVAAPVLLHLLRIDNKITMAQVAKKMGVPYQSYQRMESGKNLTMKSIKRAARALGATVEISIRKVDSRKRRRA